MGNLLFHHLADITSSSKIKNKLNLGNKGKFGFKMAYLGLAQCILCNSQFKINILYQGYSTLLKVPLLVKFAPIKTDMILL